MSVPAAVTTVLNDALIDSLSVAALALIVVVVLAGFKYMRKAVGDSPWSSYTISDDIQDRALTRNAERPFEEVNNSEDWRADRKEAAHDVTRNQRWF